MSQQAQIIIVGGGIVGCSTAYHLSLMGVKDVIVLEKGELTSGSTWHAAGLVGQLRSSRNITQMLKYSVELYRNLEKKSGLPTGWREVGGLRVASSKDRMYELKKGATTAKSFGLEMHMLSPQEAYDLFPIMDLNGVEGAAFLPTDGYADPSGITQALAKLAKQGGVTFKTNTRVEGVKKSGDRFVLTTDKGDYECEKLVNCAGMWAREFGQMMGVNVPLIPVQHQYLVTDDIEGLPDNLATMRDPDSLVYFKKEMGGLVMGGYERNPIPWSTNGIPRDFGQELLAPNFDHFTPLSELALKRVPILGEVGVRKLINGPEAFTPDGNFIMGEAPNLRNYFVGAGFNAHGIAAGGGAGKMLAEWVEYGRPSLDMWSADIKRFGKYTNSLWYTTKRTEELYGKHYTISWPHEEHDSVRGIKKSPLYQSLKKGHAVFGSKSGWERPNWFATVETDKKDIYSFEKPNWFEAVAREHHNIRENVALIDQTSFAKFEVTGPGALSYLNFLAANNVDKPEGTLTYTQLCNERGGIECDLTIGRTGPESFYIVTGTAFGTHDFAWFERHLPNDGSVRLREITGSKAVINICGPNSRRVLEKVTLDDVSHEAFAFGTLKVLDLQGLEVMALRVTYVGELGWELHIPVEYAQSVYDKLWEAGEEFGIQNAGYRAIETLRLEKGFRYWSSDITPDYNPYEAGLGFCVDLKKENFLGKEALTQIKQDGPKQRLCCFTIDQEIELFGGETLIADGQVVGVLTSGGFGHTVQKTIAYGYLPTDKLKAEKFEIECLGVVYSATRHKGTLYDPKRARILC